MTVLWPSPHPVLTGPPRLRIVDRDELDPVLPPATGPAVHVWHDRDGRPAAYGYTVAGCHWMHVPGIATFRLAGPAEVTAVAATGASLDAIGAVYRRAVLPFALQACGMEVLHASAVVASRGVVAFCAGSGTGKSTLVYGLARRGYRPWADDAIAFQASGSTVRTVPLPFQIRLRPSSASYFRQSGQLSALSPGTTGTDPPLKPALPLATVFVLRRLQDSGDGQPMPARRLTPGEALAAVLAHAQSFSMDDPERKRGLVAQYFSLVAHVPVFELVLPSSLERLTAVLDEIERTIT